MNYLSIDFGTKFIGLAYSINGIIFTIKSIPNDSNATDTIHTLTKTHTIGKIYVGLSTGRVAKLTQNFIKDLLAVIKLPIETVEESVSTIEAGQLLIQSKSKKRNYKKLVDSVSAAVILQRVIS